MRIHRTLLRSLAAVALAGSATLASGCRETPVQPDPELRADGDTVAFHTDAASYTLTRGAHGYNGRIVAVYVNRTGKPVYIANCNGTSTVTLEKWENGAWRPAYSPPTFLCLSLPMDVPPGGTQQFEVNLADAFARPDGTRASEAEVRGQYRAVWQDVVWDLLPDANRTTQLPLELRHSNVFTLNPAP